MLQESSPAHCSGALAEMPLSAATPVVYDSVDIPAEPGRALFALTIPEYIEAWLTLPGADRVECHMENRSYDRFRIEIYSLGSVRQSILGSCLLSKPNRITYLWDRDRVSGKAGSIVEMELLSDRNRSRLKLKHGAFSSRAEAQFYSTVWRSSLLNLRRMFTAGLNS